MELDLILEGGEVLDGTGCPARRLDVGIHRGRVAALGDLRDHRAHCRLSVAGRVMTPGFIDIHSHSDVTLMQNPLAHSKVRQGVTTEVVGNCGFSLAPVVPEYRTELRDYLTNTVNLDDETWSRWHWASMMQFYDHLQRRGLSVNLVPLAGHGTVRVGAMGLAERAPTAAELERMCRLVQQEMDEGAFGISFGLEYAPDAWSGHDEMVAAMRVVAAAGGLMAVHMRSEGDGLLDAIDEVVAVARESGVSLEISHLKAERRQNHGRVREALARIRAARAAGVAVEADVYPYVAFGSGLMDLLPPWARAEGIASMMRVLRDPAGRARVAREMLTGTPDWPSFLSGLTFADIRITTLRHGRGRSVLGKSLAEIAAARGLEPPEAVIDLLLAEEGGVKMIVFAMAEEDVQYLLAQPDVIISSDARAMTPDGPLGQIHCHPRYYGAFPRVLGHYSRELGLLSLPEAVRKMTSLPARKLGLRDRGEIRPGAVADLVVLDPDRVAERATYEDPHRYPDGIDHVLVAGVPVVLAGNHTGATPGQVLRRTA